ncbi:MAG: hypothetical protein Q4C96_01290 [Planctomycetia bacterium]|nr:hypothetical protein [Planctomycetia bacterium]
MKERVNFMHFIKVVVCGLLFAEGFFSYAFGQQVTSTVGRHHVGDSFGESIGTSWAIGGKNWFMNYGGGGARAKNPMFGGYQPGMGMQTGFNINRGDVKGRFNAWAGQGTSRSYGGESISGTFMNGQQIYVGDVQVTPFVTGLTPVVGGWHQGPQPVIGGYDTYAPEYGNPTVREALQRVKNAQAEKEGVLSSEELRRAALGTSTAKFSSPTNDYESEENTKKVSSGNRKAYADRGTPSAEMVMLSVSEMRKLRQQEQAEDHQRAVELVKKGREAEKKGKSALAKSYYKEALLLADEKLEEKIQRHLRKMD